MTQTSFGGKLSFIPSFRFPERLHCCYIYFHYAPTYTTTIITLEPCALNAEFQHFILKIFHYFADITEREALGGERESDFRDKVNV